MAVGHGGRRTGAGRPKGAIGECDELREEAKKHTQAALAVIVKIMENPKSSQRLKAAEIILARGHGAPKEEPATVDIINRFMDNKISAISACLLIEAAGLDVPAVMLRYYANEIARGQHTALSEQAGAYNAKPPLLNKF